MQRAEQRIADRLNSTPYREWPRFAKAMGWREPTDPEWMDAEEREFTWRMIRDQEARAERALAQAEAMAELKGVVENESACDHSARDRVRAEDLQMSRIAELRRLYEESDGNTNIEFEQFMPALARAWPEIDALLTAAQGAVTKAQAMFERTGTVIDKWPPSDDLMPPWESGRRAPWTRERIAALPDEVRWMGIVFSLYTDLCEIDNLARHVDENDG